MKTSILITAGLLFVSLFSFAQDNDMREKLNFGIRGGANLANVWDEQSQDFKFDSKIGGVGGVFLAIPIGKYVGVQPELQFSQKGFQGDGSILGMKYNYSYTSTFLDVPILFAFKPSPYLSIFVGPQYSFLLNERSKFNSDLYSEEEFKENQNDNIRKNIFGVQVGADINVNHFVISPRAGWDLQSNNGDGTSSNPRYKNQWLQLTLGYRF